jgi:hypothetical protein
VVLSSTPTTVKKETKKVEAFFEHTWKVLKEVFFSKYFLFSLNIHRCDYIFSPDQKSCVNNTYKYIDVGGSVKATTQLAELRYNASRSEPSMKPQYNSALVWWEACMCVFGK